MAEGGSGVMHLISDLKRLMVSDGAKMEAEFWERSQNFGGEKWNSEKISEFCKKTSKFWSFLRTLITGDESQSFLYLCPAKPEIVESEIQVLAGEKKENLLLSVKR